MKRSLPFGAALVASGAIVLVGCSGSSGAAGGDPDTLTVSGWSVSTTPEFQLLADGFEAAHEGVTVEIVDYDPTEYNTLLTADLAAGTGPDIVTQKEVKFVTTFQEGGQLADVSDVELPDGIGGADSYVIDGAAYATPYRQDSWVLYYNKALFDEAGLDYPDGSWTWDDYVAAAETLSEGTDAKGAYQHSWQSVVQGFANAQSGADILAGDYDYLAPFYERALALQDAGAQESFNTVSANQLTYQGEFGTQRAAMMPMGTWYVATLVAQQASGEADDFDWGIAPIPQADEARTGIDQTPVTFGDPTGFGVNANISEDKQELAKEFLAYAASEDAAVALAGIGITPAALGDAAVDAYFAADGAPQDDLSRFAVQTHETLPENPTSSETAAVQNILNDLHTAVLSGSADIDQAIAEAEERVASEVGGE
ncbi:ABC transporter substrate-binding protein [Microbacterium excoecariae]|uniref:ABC transporter substrate-binding protein n=1 Tax=Microbacterium excoecariae TaxID=2715210 RepID=UPI00140A7CA4|nr:extracellular solute-binding protein [Microbacterium excoecariae]NHI16601.1 extracellular solute-binding protein [Microbacterium excoecariae]